MNFNANEQGTPTPIVTKPSISPAEARIAAAELVRQDIVNERLHGDDKLWKSWARTNASFLDYRTRLKIAELDGTQVNVQKTDQAIADGRAKRKWIDRGTNSVMSPDGVVMTKVMARRLGYTEE